MQLIWVWNQTGGGNYEVKINYNYRNYKMENKICSNCVMDITDPNITFDSDGVCDFCLNYKNNIFENLVVNRNQIRNQLNL